MDLNELLKKLEFLEDEENLFCEIYVLIDKEFGKLKIEKETAKKIAQKIREMGLSARVVPTKVDTYEVYVPLKQYKKVMKKTIRGGKARKKKSRKKRKRR